MSAHGGRSSAGSAAAEVVVQRVYEEPQPGGGARVLVDRLWPRGVAKATAPWDDWCKQVAPTPELRTWYGHDPDRFEEFARRYRAELTDGEQHEALESLRDKAAHGRLTLLTATKESQISAAEVLRQLLTER